MSRTSLRFALGVLALVLAARSAGAGPPLLCHAIVIGEARSLPFGQGPFAIDRSYRFERVVPDTLDLLRPETPVLVRMETLRRATLYAVRDVAVAQELRAALMARALASAARGTPDALAWFDAGYLEETFKETTRYGGEFLRHLGGRVKEGSLDGLSGYAWVLKGIELRGQDAEMEFAAALITRGQDKTRWPGHLRKAAGGAAEGSLLSRNLMLRFGEEAGSLEALRAAH
jgi:hypothetical protein